VLLCGSDNGIGADKMPSALVGAVVDLKIRNRLGDLEPSLNRFGDLEPSLVPLDFQSSQGPELSRHAER